MRLRPSRILTSPFLRNVATVATGTAAAQLLSFIFAPVLTRIYSPEALGELGTFTAAVTMLSPVFTLTYPLAIVLQKHDADARQIARLSTAVACSAAVVTFLLLLAFIEHTHTRLGLAPRHILALPLATLTHVSATIGTQWTLRLQLFRLRAAAAVLHSLATNTGKALLGLVFTTSSTLIAVSIAGMGLHGALLRFGRPERQPTAPTGTPLLHLAKRHYDFPAYRAPQNLINAASFGLPVILLAAWFGPATAGFYALARTTMGAPATLLAQAVGEVFYPRIVAASHSGENQYDPILKITAALAGVGAIPFAAIAVAAPDIYQILFGPDWESAGHHARWLSIFLFFNFINRPCVAAVPVLKAQRGLMIYEVASTSIRITALYFGYRLWSSDTAAVAAFSITGAVAYTILIAWVLHRARRTDRNRDATAAGP